jgi:hypothetical protein
MAKLIGTDPNQVPTNADLGDMAYKDGANLQAGPLTITDNNVGIGTTSPVNNSNRTTLGLQGVWGGQLDIMVGSTVHAQFGTDNFSTGQSARIQSQDGIVFKTSGSNERMRIDSNGRVGINYTNMGLANAYGDGLVVSKSTIAGSSGISVIAATNGYSSLYLGDSGDTFVGGLEYNHNNDGLGIYANNKRVINLAAGGEVTMPYQPAFMAKKNITQENIAATTTVTVNFDDEIFDNGGDYNGNATFTAPVTGKYQFNVNIRLANGDTSAGYYHVHVRTSNRVFGLNLQSLLFAADPTYWSFHGAILADMDAGDTCYVTIYQHLGAAQADLQGSSETTFSGFLVA